MKTSCSLSAFKLPLEEALDQVVGLGFTHVDLICIPGFKQIMPEEVAADPAAAAARVGDLLRARGLTAVALNCAVPTPHDRRDAAQNAERTRLSRGLARFAKLLGVPVLSFYPGFKAPERDPDAVLADAVATFREWIAIGQEEGVELVPEPHWNTPFETPAQLAALCAACPELRLAVDPSHFICVGETGCQWRPFFDRTAHVHVRDAREGELCVDWGTGDLVKPGWLELLKASGYDGYVAVEYLPKDGLDLAASLSGCRAAVEAV